MNHTACRSWWRGAAVCFVTLAAFVFVLTWSRGARAQECGLCPSPLGPALPPFTEGTKQNARQFLANVRERFPDHVQATFQTPIATGRTAIVVAEPPPHATAEAIQQRLGASHVEVVQRRVGHDGWTKDLIAIVDHQDRTALGDSLVRLDAYLYGTSYRSADSPSESRRIWKVSGLDVSVAPNELKRWVLGDDVRFTSVDGAVSISSDDLRRKKAR